MTDRPAILAEGLCKSFGETRALEGIDLGVQTGTVLGLLGPNGAGKTTTVRILTTLLRPDAGRAEVAGYDVVTQPHEVRSRIGLTGQYVALDEYLTGRENLVMMARLARLGRRAAALRAQELLERFDLADAADRLVKTYSGGMRRRLDLAAGLIASPPVLFLDEPTTGLDPRSRLTMWDLIAELVRGGTTLLLTTQYLEEADRLADLIAVVDHGRVIARGSAQQLKDEIGGDQLEVTVAQHCNFARALEVLARLGDGEPHADAATKKVSIPFSDGPRRLPQLVRELDDASIELEDISVRKPTLDDVFLSLTGRTAQETAEPSEPRPEAEPERVS